MYNKFISYQYRARSSKYIVGPRYLKIPKSINAKVWQIWYQETSKWFLPKTNMFIQNRISLLSIIIYTKLNISLTVQLHSDQIQTTGMSSLFSIRIPLRFTTGIIFSYFGLIWILYLLHSIYSFFIFFKAHLTFQKAYHMALM